MTDDDLEALVRGARQRDPDAWEALYRRAYPRLLAYARRRLASREQADDAVSETMTRAIAQIEDFRWSGAGVDAWLYGILRNVTHEAGRAQSRLSPVPVPDVESVDDPGVLDRLVHADTLLSVRSAFERLEPDEQEVLELRVVGRLGAEAVGQVLDKRAGAVRTAQSRALGKLRQLLGQEEGGGG